MIHCFYLILDYLFLYTHLHQSKKRTNQFYRKAFKKPPLNIIKDYNTNCVILQFHPSAFYFPPWTLDILRLFVGLFQLTLLEDAWNVPGVTVWVA